VHAQADLLTGQLVKVLAVQPRYVIDEKREALAQIGFFLSMFIVNMFRQ